jgi:hypothetical protein
MYIHTYICIFVYINIYMIEANTCSIEKMDTYMSNVYIYIYVYLHMCV